MKIEMCKCDRCGEQDKAASFSVILTLEVQEKRNDNPYAMGLFAFYGASKQSQKTWDLCADCSEDFRAFLLGAERKKDATKSRSRVPQFVMDAQPQLDGRES